MAIPTKQHSTDTIIEVYSIMMKEHMTTEHSQAVNFHNEERKVAIVKHMRH